MKELPGVTTARPAAVALVCCLVAAGCSSAPEVEERPPDAFGWVVAAEPSPDYRYDSVADQVAAGVVTLTLEDGTSVAVLPSTAVSGRGCTLFDAPAGEGLPCWVHVGLGPDGATAAWLALARVDWVPTAPGEVPVADRVYFSRALAEEHDDRLVLKDGTVLPFDRSRVEVAVLGVPDPSLDDALGRLAPQGLCDIVVDQETGAVTLLDCRLPY